MLVCVSVTVVFSGTVTKSQNDFKVSHFPCLSTISLQQMMVWIRRTRPSRFMILSGIHRRRPATHLTKGTVVHGSVPTTVTCDIHDGEESIQKK
ncbi:rCG57687 [Rattus norvegicus]|uniref:RCG57687 n=1 Tax=Rattus norvegicus TaxID=10116 RepID=A6JHS7_RAT|nr:rCG57687 [Rattus norvegicus]